MLLFAGLLLQLHAAKPLQWRVVEEVTITWAPQRGKYTISLDEPIRTQANDEQWQRIRIRTPTGREFTTRSGPGPLVAVREGVLDSALVADNGAQSTHFYLSPKLRTRRGAPVLVLFGWAYAGNPGS